MTLSILLLKLGTLNTCKYLGKHVQVNYAIFGIVLTFFNQKGKEEAYRACLESLIPTVLPLVLHVQGRKKIHETITKSSYTKTYVILKYFHEKV